MPTIDRDGATIWYEDHGWGDAVLLVHGGLFDSMDADHFWLRPGIADDLVAAGYRVLAPDRRFHGRTSTDFVAHSWQVEATDLAAVLHAAGVPAAHLVAGSNGCSAAARLALEAPSLARSLTLCWPVSPENAIVWNAFDRTMTEIAAMDTVSYLEMLERKSVSRVAEARAGFFFVHALLHDERARAGFAHMDAADAAEVMRRTAMRMLPGGPLRGVTAAEAAALGDLDFVVTVIPAEPEDPYHPAVAARSLVAAIPGARVAPGYPVSPSPAFAVARAAFTSTLRSAFGVPTG